jgi:integrase
VADTATKMRDGLVKRGETWSYVIRVPNLSTGKTKPKWVGGFPTRKAAKEARDSARHATHRGTYVERTQLTLGEWLETWLEAHAVELRPATLDSYQRIARLYVLTHPIAHERLQQLTPVALSAHWRHVHATGNVKGGPVSVRTVRYAHSVVRGALNDAVRNRLLEVNPATHANVPKDPHAGATGRTPDAWAPDDLRTFLDSTEGTRLWPLWVLMSHTGMRRGEALALQWQSLDLEAGTLRVQRAVSDVGHGPMYGPPKNGEARTVHVPPVVRQALRDWRKAQAAEQLQAGGAWADADGLVFTMPDGRPVAPSFTSKAFTKAVAAAGVPVITLHGLRHTAATLLLRAGVSVHLVARLLGHKDPSITLQVYSHAIPGDDSAVADQLAQLIAGQ